MLGYGVLAGSQAKYEYLPALGAWGGPASRNKVHVSMVQSEHIVPGMSGAPVCAVKDGAVVGIQSAWIDGRAWVIPVEALADLVAGDPDVPSVTLSAVPPTGLRELPSDQPLFTGRSEELDALDSIRASDRAVKLAVICGTAGVGKTALAVHWAHRASPTHPPRFQHNRLASAACDNRPRVSGARQAPR